MTALGAARPLGLVSLATAPKSVDGDVTALLLDCHQRIRDFCALGRRLAAVPAPDSVVADTAARVHRYFAEALPLHAADEERSLEPRLRGRSPALDAALDRMAREHREHQPLLGRLGALTASLHDQPGRQAELGPELSTLTRRLELALLEHLEHEERVILPALAALLPPRVHEDLVREFAARRRRPPAP